MKYFLSILLFFSLKVSAQDTLVLKGKSSVDSSKNFWRQVSGAQAVLVAQDLTLNITGLKTGVYQFELSCTDFWGTGRDTVRVTVLAPEVKMSATVEKGYLILKTEGEGNVDYYLIEKSSGKNWQLITKQKATKSDQYKIKLL